MSLTCTSVSPCIALGTGAPAAGRGGGVYKGQNNVFKSFCFGIHTCFSKIKKAGTLGIFYVLCMLKVDCILVPDYTKF